MRTRTRGARRDEQVGGATSYAEAVLGCQRLLDGRRRAVRAPETHEPELLDQTEPEHHVLVLVGDEAHRQEFTKKITAKCPKTKEN